MSITQKQIAKIARATKQNCSESGSGNVVVVFDNGDYTVEADENSVIARKDGDGWDYRIKCFKFPQDADDVEYALNEAIKNR